MLIGNVPAQAQQSPSRSGFWTIKAPLTTPRSEAALATASAAVLGKSLFLTGGSNKPGSGAVTGQTIVFGLP